MKTHILSIGLLALCACAPVPHQSAFYIFSSSDLENAKISDTSVSIDVARIKIPEYLDRPQMVTSDGVNVYVAPHDRWAEGLSPMIQRKVISDLGAMLPNSSVTDADFVPGHGDYNVFIDVYDCGGMLDGDVRMTGTYAVYADTDDGVAGHTVRNFQYTAHAGNDYADYARRLGNMTERLSHDIARDIAKMSK